MCFLLTQPRLERALATLPEADLWWRPHANTTRVGNLLVHLEGNVEHFSWHVRQIVWIAKMRGGPDHGVSFHDDVSLNKRER